MKNIYLNIYKSNLANLKKAKKSLENNNLIGFPTETVYGLAGNAYSNKSIQKIYSLKNINTVNDEQIKKNVFSLGKSANVACEYISKLMK